MPDLSFRVYFSGKAAAVEDLAAIDEITVEQGEDAAWEARIVMALCLDDQGNWARQKELNLRARTQVRVELQIGSAGFKPLIEGPIVSLHNTMDSRPGRSSITITVHDDSAWLNLKSGPVSVADKTDEVIARQLFIDESEGHIATTRAGHRDANVAHPRATQRRPLLRSPRSDRRRQHRLPETGPGSSAVVAAAGSARRESQPRGSERDRRSGEQLADSRTHPAFFGSASGQLHQPTIG